MQRSTFLIFLVLIIAIGGGSVWYLMHTRQASLEQLQESATSTQEVAAGQSIYTNGTYGFTVFYPGDAGIDYDFAPTYHLGSAWRASALPEAQGTPIISIIPYSVENEHTYPRYFHAMVRIGASDDPKEIAACLAPTPDQGETALADTVINGTTWKTFSFESAGMMQYARGVSYRTVHEGKCIALEKIRTGSSYRDEPNEADIDDGVLDAAYESLDPVIMSFSFARP
jgi:hypothetical protein